MCPAAYIPHMSVSNNGNMQMMLLDSSGSNGIFHHMNYSQVVDDLVQFHIDDVVYFINTTVYPLLR